MNNENMKVAVTFNSVRHIIDKNLKEIDETPLWIGKRCNDCGNEKCKSLGKLPKGYDCALWQAKESGDNK